MGILDTLEIIMKKNKKKAKRKALLRRVVLAAGLVLGFVFLARGFKSLTSD